MKKILIPLILITASLAAKAQKDSLFVTTSDSVRLYVERSGKGIPVLFIHGGPGSLSGYFKNTGGRIFEQDVEMIYLDQRGCGSSENAANKNYSLDRIIRDFEEVRKALGIEKWILMPHSFGGILATEYAYRHPGSIYSMVYLNCTISIDHSARSGINAAIDFLKPDWVPQLHNEERPLMERWGMAFGELRKKGIFWKVMFGSKENFEKHDSITQAGARHFEFGQLVWSYPEYFEDFSEKTSKISVPVLVISGTRDFTIGIDHPKLMRFPSMQVKYLYGGHALYMEHNYDLYKAVKPFLVQQIN